MRIPSRASNFKGARSDVLFFGCRRENKDYIYKEELAHYLESGVVSSLLVAFSRKTSDKLYVQHLLHTSQFSLGCIRKLGTISVYLRRNTYEKNVLNTFERMVAGKKRNEQRGIL